MNNDISASDFIEFDEIHKVEEWGNYYHEWARQYKESMVIANKVIKSSTLTSIIECYCGYSYRGINEYLRFGERGQYNNLLLEEALPLFEGMANALAIVLSMAPRTPNNLVVYRLACDDFIKKLIENNKIGIPTIEKGFISTSLIKDITDVKDEAFSANNNLLKIYVKANTVGIYVNEVTKRPEYELLLYPNGYFRLLKKPYRANNKTIYECELFYF